MATILLGLDQPKGWLYWGAAALTTEQPRKIWSSVNFTVITVHKDYTVSVIAFLIYINLETI